MLIYLNTKKQFIEDVKVNDIADKLSLKFRELGLSRESNSEHNSWTNSLREMCAVLDDDSFHDDLEIALEYQIPMTAKRIDFFIAGVDNRGSKHAVIIELKQWSEASRTSRTGIVVAYVGQMKRTVPHPSFQAYTYEKTLENFNANISQHQIQLHSCSYLHNYKKSKINELVNEHYSEIIQNSPVFTEPEQLRDYIREFITSPEQSSIMQCIDEGSIRATKAVQDSLGEILRGNSEFIMLDEQKVVYETAIKLVKNAINKNKKYTIIIEGGPGTGKSVIAIQLLAELNCKMHLNAHYVTKNAAPRNVYFEKLKNDDFKAEHIRSLFKSSSSYYNCAQNEFDCLIIDEAHRLNEKSGYNGDSRVNQIKEIIQASKVSVFFIDEDQIVTAKDIGSVEEIKKWAAICGSEVYYGEDTKLSSQFRCNGSDGYIAFIDGLIGIRQTADYSGFDVDYDIRVFDDPCAMREELRVKNLINNKARMLAGYCYDWNTRGSNDTSIYDIELENGFKARWNFNTTPTWAIDEDSFDQIGCIHTCQGLEFDYVGVIIGKDLRFEHETVITDPSKRANDDYSLRGIKKNQKTLADKIIRNTYKTLLTRGQKGCYIYCEDENLNNYFKERISVINANKCCKAFSASCAPYSVENI